MKKIKILTLVFLFLAAAVFAQEPSEIFSLEDIATQLKIGSTVKVIPLTQSGQLSEFRADVYFFPKADRHTMIEEFTTQPKSSIIGNKLRFEWRHPSSEDLEYSYNTLIATVYNVPKIYSRIKYPIRKVPENAKIYTRPTEIIDSNRAAIKKKAQELAEGKDDLYDVVTTIAAWVKENIKYDLSTLTEQASQKAGWVLANKIGVCDEITSLFIAMLRSLGIPAKFVSGVSYASSPNFPEKWGAHGWAEVYYPGIGWVPYDVTFGEFGWIDAGHIKMMESKDPQEPSTRFEWKGNNVDVEVQDLEIDAKIHALGLKRPYDISMYAEAEKKEVGPGSYNLIKATVENLKDYYVTTEIALAKVEELEILKEKQTVMLKPKETKTATWLVKVKEDISKDYIYKIPTIVYTIKNETDQSSFTVAKSHSIFSKQEIERLSEGFEKEKIEGIDLTCSITPDTLNVGETAEMKCTVENKQENTMSGQYCFEECESFSLESNEKKEFTHKYFFDKAGSQDVIFSINSDGKTAKSILNVNVIDRPRIKITDFSTTEFEKYGEDFKISFKAERESFATPKNVKLIVEVGRSEVEFDITSLDTMQEFIIDANTASFLRKEEKIKIFMTYEDELSKEYEQKAEFPAILKKATLWDKIRMFFGRIFG